MNIELTQKTYDAITQESIAMYEGKYLLPMEQALMRLMDLPGVPIHYPYHHYILPAAMLAMAAIACNHELATLQGWLQAAEERAKLVPGGSCGNCGNCGAAVGAGIFCSVYTGTSPMTRDHWSTTVAMTGQCLLHIAKYPGPRCCKRTTFLAAQAACTYAQEHLHLPLDISSDIQCRYASRNPDCTKQECPFFAITSSMDGHDCTG